MFLYTPGKVQFSVRLKKKTFLKILGGNWEPSSDKRARRILWHRDGFRFQCPYIINVVEWPAYHPVAPKRLNCRLGSRVFAMTECRILHCVGCSMSIQTPWLYLVNSDIERFLCFGNDSWQINWLSDTIDSETPMRSLISRNHHKNAFTKGK